MAIVHMGYVGSCYVKSASGSGGAFFITGSSLNPVQELNTPELMAGRASPYLYNWAKIETGGNVTGPLFEGASTMGQVWDWTFKRTTDLDHMATSDIEVDIAYYKSTGRSFTNCSINSFEVSITAGDVANFTIDFFGHGSSGAGVTESTTLSGSAGALTRLITWDVCSFQAIGSSGTMGIGGTDIQGFNLTLANNLQRAYAVGAPTGYAPFDVVAGIRRLTGTITSYAQTAPSEWDAKNDWGSSQAGSSGASVCEFDIGGANGGSSVIKHSNILMMLKRSQAAGKTDIATYTVDFQAVAFDDLT